MPFLSVKITPPAGLVQKRFERLRRKIPIVSRKRMYDAAVAIRHEMKQPGAKPDYPIKFDTPRQQKAFFASDGFGRGIPTKRGSEYIRGWQVIRTEPGYDVGNPLTHAKFIGGTARSTSRQSRIHRGRWILFKVVKDKALAKLPKAVKESLQQTARQEGFRTK
jgi:hypothetical protein